MTGPNRLSNEARPNVIRTGPVEARDLTAAPANALDAARSRPRPGGPARRARTGRAFVGALVLAAAGLPLFFSGELTGSELGIALICFGVGLAFVVMARRALLDDVAAARGSRSVAVASMIFMPHTIVFGVIGLGLVAFGLLILGVAIGVL